MLRIKALTRGKQGIFLTWAGCFHGIGLVPLSYLSFLKMHIDIYFLSAITVWIVNLLALIIGCLYCYRADLPNYLKIFPFYLFVSIGLEFFAHPYLRSVFKLLPSSANQRSIGFTLYNFYTVFETFAFTWFLFQVIRSGSIKRIAILLLFLFILFFTKSALTAGLGSSINDLAVLFESVIVITLCLTFFRELFSRPEPVDLLKEPSFWLVTGIFFYLATIFPLFLTRPWLLDQGLAKVVKSLYSINNFALSVTYMLFIKGFTCRTRKL